ncbi:MAG: hypothetical protein OXM02_12630 [Bacteroidota bacterium]|nr:hypothetical protein [Bacteroidota bacterium]
MTSKAVRLTHQPSVPLVRPAVRTYAPRFAGSRALLERQCSMLPGRPKSELAAHLLQQVAYGLF